MQMAMVATESKTAPKTFGWLGFFRMAKGNAEERRRIGRRKRSTQKTKEEDE